MLVEEQICWVNCVPLSSVLLTIAYGDKVTNITKKVYHTDTYDKHMSGTGVRLEFPRKVKFHTDSCLRCRGMIPSYDNSVYSIPVVHL